MKNNSMDIPHNLQIEKDVIGMLLRDNNSIDFMGRINKNWFYKSINKDIFESISGLIANNKTASVELVSLDLGGNQGFVDLGGVSYLQEVISNFSFLLPQNASDVLKQLYIKRKMINIGENLAVQGFVSPVAEVSKEISKTYNSLDDLLNSESDDKTNPISRRIGGEATSFVKTGFKDLDKKINGLAEGKLIVIGARPSMGKTSFVISLLDNICSYNDTEDAYFFSLECNHDEMRYKLISQRTGISVNDMMFGKVPHHKISLFKDAEQRLPQNLLVCNGSAITVNDIAARARKQARKRKLSCLVIDYLGYIDMPQDNRTTTDRIGDVTKRLKMLSNELKIPVVLLSQLSRECEKRSDKRPLLSDLRSSGSIEQDADIIMFIHREEYYNNARTESALSAFEKPIALGKPNVAEIIIAKNRNGETGTVELKFDKHSTAFSDLEESVF